MMLIYLGPLSFFFCFRKIGALILTPALEKNKHTFNNNSVDFTEAGTLFKEEYKLQK